MFCRILEKWVKVIKILENNYANICTHNGKICSNFG